MRHILTAILALEISLAMTLVPLGTKIWVANDLNDVFRAVGTIYVFLLRIADILEMRHMHKI